MFSRVLSVEAREKFERVVKKRLFCDVKPAAGETVQPPARNMT
jgi:hypothetical protein